MEGRYCTPSQTGRAARLTANISVVKPGAFSRLEFFDPTTSGFEYPALRFHYGDGFIIELPSYPKASQNIKARQVRRAS